MSEYIKGTCNDMCPAYEVRLRTKEKLLHFFELKPGGKYEPIPGKVVKSFSRSAAGLKAPRASDLRTVNALQKTIQYLLKDIAWDKRKPFNLTYDFIFDRLRSVRQEMVMQNFDSLTLISLLEPIIMFLAYSSYRLCTETIDNFDPKICNQHLQECLKKILCCYDEIDSENVEQNLQKKKNRTFIEALYQIFNLGSVEALKRSFSLKQEVRSDSTFHLTNQISLLSYLGNYYKVIEGIPKLPHILCAVASLKLPTIRREMLHRFSYAYDSKQLTVPVTWMKDLLLYSDINSLLECCKYYNIEIIQNNEKNLIRFRKQSFDATKTEMSKTHETFVDEKLKKVYLPETLLLKRI